MSLESNKLGKFSETTRPNKEWTKKLLSHADYRDHSHADNEPGTPYIYKITNGQKKLCFFGSPHINNPENKVFDQIETVFFETKPEIVFVEGWQAINQNRDYVIKTFKQKSKKEMKQAGESHFVLKLAVDAGIDFESPEPDFAEEIDYLLKNSYTKKDIFQWYMYRQISQYQRMYKKNSQTECVKYLAHYIDDFKKKSGWDHEKINAFKENTYIDLDLSDEQKYSDRIDPIPWQEKEQTTTNEIARDSNNFRDTYILNRIKDSMQKYSSLFVVYGSSHAVRQELALRDLLEN